MKQIVVILLASLALMSVSLSEKDLSQQDHPIHFEIRKGFWSVEGHFSEVSTDIRFDPSFPEQTVLLGSAQVSSLNTDNSTRDRHLMGAEWFDAAHHPQIQMQATSVEKSGTDYHGTFLITIKGKRISKELDFNLNKGPENAYLSTSFSLSRETFALEGSNPVMEALLGDEVKIYLNIPLEVQAL